MRKWISSGVAYAALAAAAALAVDGAAARDLRGALSFEGRFLVAVSDADMVASAYVDGDLGPRDGRDALSVIALGDDPRSWRVASIAASNSVAGPPAAVDVTRDGRWAFVIETWTQRPEGEGPHAFSDLAHGARLFLFDLADPSAPRLAQTVETPERPDAVRVSPDGATLAVTFHPAGDGAETPIALYPFEEGRLGAPSTPSIAGWSAGERLIDIDWHPTEPVLAMISESTATLRFARVTPARTIEPFGNVVSIERAPYRVFFTPDGRHAIANGLYWGADIAGRWIEAPRGSVVSVRMNADGAGEAPRHALVSRVTTGVSPEGLAISPDGRWVATTNLERSYLPYDDARITWFSSITLARLDPETGVLSHVGEFAYDGILPEAAVFDNSSRYLAVANYDHFDDRKPGSSIDIWRIATDPLEPNRVRLVKTEHSAPVARGAHSLVIAR